MPGPLLLPLLSMGLSAAGSASQSILQAGANRANRQFSEDMYNKQRADALADFNMQNAYNAPSAQMARFREAGLNPNLIYGQQTSTPSVRSSSVPSYDQKAPDVAGIGKDAMSAYFNTKIAQQTTNNMQMQQKLLQSQIAATDAGTLNTLSRTELNKFNLGLMDALKANTLASREIALQKASISKDILSNQAPALIASVGKRNNLMDASVLNMTQSALHTGADTERIKVETKRLDAAVTHLGLQNEYSEAENRLAKAGIMRGDPSWLRMIITALSKKFPSLLDILGLGNSQ